MEKKEYRCRNCGHDFITEIMKIEEARDRKFQLVPVTCPRCRSQNIEEKKRYH